MTNRNLLKLFTYILFATAGLSMIYSCDNTTTTGGDGNNNNGGDTTQIGDNSLRLETGIANAQNTKGAPFEPQEPNMENPNEDEYYDKVPDGPKVGDMKPENDAFKLRGLKPRGKSEEQQEKAERAALYFKDYKSLSNTQNMTSSCCPELSVAENEQTVMLTGNGWMALSEDGGANFTVINPTTLFPQTNGGFCCDQILHYVPQIDMFVWLLQYRKDTEGDNIIRIAAQTTNQIRNSNGTAWTYWDFKSDVFNKDKSLDYNDMTFGTNSLWWCTNSVGKGRNVVRIKLSEIAAKSTIHYQFAKTTPNAYFSHITQNARNTVYWGGHLSNSELRVYSMKDGDNFYSWNSLTVNSWPNGDKISNCPSGQNWMGKLPGTHHIMGNALKDGKLWLGWAAAAGGGFDNPHYQIVEINTNNWTKTKQMQIWNPDVAFGYTYFATNAEGELGLSVGFGGENTHPSHAVGVWGDYVVYYPELSTRCTSRWGDYNTVRRAQSNKGMDFVAGGYSMDTDNNGNNIMKPHYIRFGR